MSEESKGMTEADHESARHVTGEAAVFRALGITVYNTVVEVLHDGRWRISREAWTKSEKRRETGGAMLARTRACFARDVYLQGSDFHNEAMSRLAEAFHVLDGVPGVRPWDAVQLRGWLEGSNRSSSRHAALFVLNVWNPNSVDHPKDPHPWPPFDVHDAWQCWDNDNRGAFLGWAETPWWP